MRRSPAAGSATPWPCLVALALAGCHEPNHAGPATDRACRSQPDAARLLAAGSLPRAIVRLDRSRGRRRVELVLAARERDHREDVGARPHEVVDQHQDEHLALDVTLSPAGDGQRVAFVLDEAHGPPPPPTYLAGKGLRGHRTLDPCGQPRDDEVTARSPPIPRLDDWRRPVVLPSEPIGIGARWQVDRMVVVDGARVHERATYQVADRTAGQLELTLVLVLAADRQAVAVPDAAAGDPVLELVALRGVGHGRLSLELASGLVAGEISTSTDARFRYGREGWQERRTDESRLTMIVPR